MGARREYVVNVILDGDATGIEPLERGLKEIDDLAEGLASHRGIKINANIGGNALETIREIQGGLDSLDDHTINVNLGGNFETQLNNIEGHLSKIAGSFETKVDVDDSGLKELQSIKDTLGKPLNLDINVDEHAIEGAISSMFGAAEGSAVALGNAIGRNFEGLASVMTREMDSVVSAIGKIQSSINSLHVTNSPGYKLANDFDGACYEVGKIQTELNNLKAPTITPQIDMSALNQYYGSYDQLGHLSMGAIGGSSLLSMIGVGAFKNVTYGNAAKEQTNEVLLRRMDANADEFKIAGKTYEGGTDTITHAVSQMRTVRNPDLISQLYAFQMATGASNEELMSNVFGRAEDTEWGQGSMVDVLAAFGESVALQTGSEQLGTSAMFDLAKAFGGQYASVDQYGVSEETLKAHGYDPKSEDVTEFMRAVGEIIHADMPNDLMETTEGGLTQLRKRFHRAGRLIGQMMMGPIDFLSSQLLKIDKSDFNFAGITIPKGTFSTVIIGMTGIVSAIGPLQQTLRAVQDTFHRVTGAVQTAKDGLIGLADKIANLGNLEKLQRFNDFGAYGILSQEKVGREKADEIFRARIQGVGNVRGIHDFTEEDIRQSGMTWLQKRRTMGGKNVDEQLFGLEKNKTLDIHKEIHRQLSKGLDKEFEESISGLTEMEKVQARSREAQRRMSSYDVGRKNQFAELTNWQKLKEGVKLSFDPKTSAFKEAFTNEKKKYKEGGWFTQLKGKTIGNIKALRKGFSAFRETGSLTESLGNLKNIFMGLVSAINPVTVILGALSVGMAALSAIFAIAWANSDEFRKKVGELGEKLHDLLDTIVYTVGDFLQSTGITEHGGAQGIVDLAIQIVEGIENVVDVLQEILLVMGGRDLSVSKEKDKIEANLEKKAKSINQKREEGKEVSLDEYKTILNLGQQMKQFDPNYFTDEKIEELGLTDHYDQKGNNFADYLKDDYSDASYDYYSETVVPQLREAGVNFTGTDEEVAQQIKDYIGTGPGAEERKTELYKSINSAKLHDQTGWSNGFWGAEKWNDTAIAKAIPNLQVKEDPQRENRSHGIWDIVGSALWWLEKIGWLVGAILTLLTVDKVLGGINSILSKRDSAGSWHGAIWEAFKEKFPDLGKKLEDIYKNGWDGLKTKVEETGTKAKDYMDKNVLNSQKISETFQKTKQTVEGMFSNIYEWVQRIKHSLNGGVLDGDGDDYLELPSGDDDYLELPEGKGGEKGKGKEKGKKTPSKDKSKLPSGDSPLELPPGDDDGSTSKKKKKKDKKKKSKKKKGRGKKGLIKSLAGSTDDVIDITDVIIDGKPKHIDPKKTGSTLEKGASTVLGKGAKDGILSKAGGFLGKIGAKIGEWLGGKAITSAIPVIGEIIDLLWIGWDLTGWICDSLSSMGVPEGLLEGIFPLRIIQNNWDNLVSGFQWGSDQIGGFLRGIGLGGVVDACQQAYTSISGLVSWVQGIPVIGWLFGGTGEGTQGAESVANNASANLVENTNATNKTTQALSSTYGGGYSSGGGYGLSPLFNNGTSSTTSPYSATTTNAMGTQNATTQTTGPITMNNTFNITGANNDEELAKKVVQIMNERFFWDAQKAGRTVDGTPNLHT